MICRTEYVSPLGPILLAGGENGLTGLWFQGQKYLDMELLEQLPREDRFPVLLRAKDWLDRYFAGEKPSSDELPLAPAGGNFRQVVWGLLRDIPYGEVTTYGALAEKAAAKLGRDSMSPQAVGGAVGHNPLSILIPCHRVVGSGGSLTGYAGGIDRKLALLRLEGVDADRFSRPKGVHS